MKKKVDENKFILLIIIYFKISPSLGPDMKIRLFDEFGNEY